MENDFWVIVVIALLIGYSGYLIGVGKAQDSINELANLKIEYNNLNMTYSQLKSDYLKLESENKVLREQQKTLEQQIASYLLEQVGIDLFGLKKYELAYGLIKIYLCNSSPTLSIC